MASDGRSGKTLNCAVAIGSKLKKDTSPSPFADVLNNSSESFLLNQFSESGCDGLVDLLFRSSTVFPFDHVNKSDGGSTGHGSFKSDCSPELKLRSESASKLSLQQFVNDKKLKLGFSVGSNENEKSTNSHDSQYSSIPECAKVTSCETNENATLSQENGSPSILMKKNASKKRRNSGSSYLIDPKRFQPTLDEKAEASRDRNRRHARNTRLRKKAYIQDLERSVQRLTVERDAAISIRNNESSQLAQLQSIRFSVLQMLLYYRASCNLNRNEWCSILEESFTCVMPITPFRSFPSSEVVGGQRLIVGIDAMIADVASLSILFESIGKCLPSKGRVQVQYYAAPEEVISSGDMLSCKWMLRTENATSCGAFCECHSQGMLRARYSIASKISHLEILFDVMGFMQQLQRASGLDEFKVVPNTLAMAKQSSDEARFITTAETPYLIVHVSPVLCTLTGFSANELIGKSAAIFQGPQTDAAVIKTFMASINQKHCCSMEVVNYTKNRVPFINHITAYPLSSGGLVTHFVAMINLDAALKLLHPPSTYSNSYSPHFLPAPMSIPNAVPVAATATQSISSSASTAEASARKLENIKFSRQELPPSSLPQVSVEKYW